MQGTECFICYPKIHEFKRLFLFVFTICLQPYHIQFNFLGNYFGSSLRLICMGHIYLFVASSFGEVIFGGFVVDFLFWGLLGLAYEAFVLGSLKSFFRGSFCGGSMSYIVMWTNDYHIMWTNELRRHVDQFATISCGPMSYLLMLTIALHWATTSCGPMSYRDGKSKKNSSDKILSVKNMCKKCSKSLKN